MYKYLIRPILFLIPPEPIHKFIVLAVTFLHKNFLIRKTIRALYTLEGNELRKEFLGLNFKNPVGLAAGFDKNADFYEEFSSFGFGHIEIGTVTPKCQPGNPLPRSFRLTKDRAIINRMGFNNLGVEHAVERLKKRPENLIIGGNIGKNTSTPNDKAIEDFSYCFEKLYDFVDYFVVNVSCPNIGDISELQDQKTLQAILARLTSLRAQKQPKKPILLKISPDLNNKQIDETIKIIENTVIDGIVATNTTITRNELKTDSRKINKIGSGGLSGAPLRDRSTEIIRYIKSKTGGKMPVIGVGGIMSAEDALEKIDAGADLVQIYTGFIYEGPGLVKSINKAFIMRKSKNKGIK